MNNKERRKKREREEREERKEEGEYLFHWDCETFSVFCFQELFTRRKKKKKKEKEKRKKKKEKKKKGKEKKKRKKKKVEFKGGMNRRRWRNGDEEGTSYSDQIIQEQPHSWQHDLKTPL